MGKVVRLEIPSGGWWEIDTAPRWGAIRNIDQTQGDASLLAAVTVAWSFDEPVSAEAVNNRETPDVLMALEVVFEKILPLFERLLQIQQRHSIKPSGTGT